MRTGLLIGLSSSILAGSRRCLVVGFVGSNPQRAISYNNNNNNKNSTMSGSSHIALKPLRHVSKSLLPDWFLPERTRVLTDNVETPNDACSCVVYWMQRDVRTVDNWALLLASHLARTHSLPLRVVYALPPPPPDARVADTDLPPTLVDMPMPARYGHFWLGGLQLVSEELAAKNIPLHVVLLQPNDAQRGVGEAVTRLVVDQLRAAAVICDFQPLRPFREWTELQAAPLFQQSAVPLWQVDAHNIVPVWVASDKRQVGARTLRPRIHKVIREYLQEFPEVLDNADEILPFPKFDREAYEKFLQMDESVGVLDWPKPGTKAGMQQFQKFLKIGLSKFAELRNDPVLRDVCSNLSPWINRGHVSFQRLTMEVTKLNKYATGSAAYIEEGVIRRELSDNFCYYEPNHYDSLTAAAGWAQETLQVHASDPREYLYSLEELEQGRTHDDLWNAAQLQVVREGVMHGFMRMYWAKKILEWTESPQVALRTAQYFNDKYALDGYDPNGFVGVGWSIMGIHDMGWKERPIFGKIRYMNYNGCKRKFKVPDYVKQYSGASENANAWAQKEEGPQQSTPKLPAKKASSSAKKVASSKKTASRTTSPAKETSGGRKRSGVNARLDKMLKKSRKK